MALPKLKEVTGSLFTGVAALGLAAMPIAGDAQTVTRTPISETHATITRTPIANQTRPLAVSQIDFPLSDARNIAENMVRFGAGQETGQHPSVALFGVTRESWARIKGAIQQSIANGYPVRAVFLGPTNAVPSLEIYAKGTRVTRPIDPNQIAPERLTILLRDIHREMYPTALASRDYTPGQ